MTNDFITIQEAAEISQKSIQTIRRAIKGKKLKTKKQKTPQGFNYLVSRDNLFAYYKIKTADSKKAQKKEPTQRATSQSVKKQSANSVAISKNEFAEFHHTLKQIVQEHSQERQNYLRLVHALQDKVVALENQMNLLAAAGSKRDGTAFGSRIDFDLHLKIKINTI